MRELTIMKNWFMLTLVGQDRTGIVAEVTRALYEGGCNLGEASMVRLGDMFTIMMMVEYDGGEAELKTLTASMEGSGLRVHIDTITGRLHQHIDPNFRITVYGADQAGIVCETTETLARLGLNIINLETDVGGTDEHPIYILHIEGETSTGQEEIESALAELAKRKHIETRVTPVNTLIG